LIRFAGFLLSGGCIGIICYGGDGLVGEAGLVVFSVLDHGVSFRIKPNDVKTKEERVYSRMVLPSFESHFDVRY
jgi:hypothetical protein